MSLSFVSRANVRDGPTLTDPRETFETYEGITCTISSFTPMTGTLYLSTYRLAFIETSPSTTQSTAPAHTTVHTHTTSAMGASSATSQGTREVMVKQVSVPLSRYVDPVVVQPWFAANYYEGQIVPLAHGGLDNIDVSGPGVSTTAPAPAAGTATTATTATAITAATAFAATATTAITNSIAALTGSSSSPAGHGESTSPGLSGSSRMMARFAFNEGGIERFHTALEHAYSVARTRHRDGRVQQRQQQEEALPLYESAGAGVGVPPEYQ